MFNFIPDFLRTALAFGVVLGILVFVHELGHYLAARWRGVHVETFSIGFGRALASWTDRGGTVWKLAWLPLGGYVKLHGQERPEDVADDVRARWIPGRTFHEKSVGSRAIIVAAGPVANFLLAVVLYGALFIVSGRPVSLPVVNGVIADSAASKAGLEVGDRITAIDGTPIHRFEELQRIVTTHAGVPLKVDISRGDGTLTLNVVPGSAPGAGGRSVGILGVRGGKVEYEAVPLWDIIPASVGQTWDVGVETLTGVWQMITAQRGMDDLGGPLRIAQLSGQVALLGVSALISWIALLSINLGLINLFPIPVLDGGHLLFYLFEAVRGRPLPQRALEYGFRAGFAALLALFVFATWNDLSHLGLVRWVAGLIG